jgi:hypothetical protein
MPESQVSFPQQPALLPVAAFIAMMNAILAEQAEKFAALEVRIVALEKVKGGA